MSKFKQEIDIQYLVFRIGQFGNLGQNQVWTMEI